MDEFDPDTVPTVGDLLNELDHIPVDSAEEGKRRTEGDLAFTASFNELAIDDADYEHTSLKPYVEMFEKHVAAILRDTRGAKKAMKEETMDF